MQAGWRKFWIAVLLSLYAMKSHGQEFRFLDKTVAVHGYFSNGGALSNHNNYLTMDTSSGNWFGDAAVNMSCQLTERLHAGAQVYDRKIGRLEVGMRRWTGRMRTTRFGLSWACGPGRSKLFQDCSTRRKMRSFCIRGH